MKGPLDNARLLMEHADEDLIAGEAILATGAAQRAVCFHAQQATEKSLKAILAIHDLDYPLTHNLDALLRLVAAAHPSLASSKAEIVSLTPYAVDGRYAGLQSPDSDRAAAALETARRVYGYAASVLSASEALSGDEAETGEGA